MVAPALASDRDGGRVRLVTGSGDRAVAPRRRARPAAARDGGHAYGLVFRRSSGSPLRPPLGAVRDCAWS